jgi:hypothetical protein
MCSLLVSCSTAIAQQTINIDWVTKKPTSPAITVDKSTPVVVVVDNVNDILYSYSERIVAHPRTAEDIQSQILGLPGAVRATADPCKPLSDAIAALDTEFKGADLNPTATNTTLPHSIALDATRAAYDKSKQEILDLDNKVGGCTDAGLMTKKDYYQRTVKPKWDDAEGKPHSFKFATTLEPMTNYSIYLLERYNGINTDACVNKDDSGKTVGVECEVVYEPISTTITASGGFLITMLPAPTYERRNAPDGSAVLAVNNTGPVRTAFAALINVKVPGPWFFRHVCPSDDSTFGCAISAGPAFELGTGNQSATRIGLVTGFSFHFWRYLYLTPAVHIGQYDSFPVGFTAAGQTIPSTFTGSLQPITKTTARFSLAITFKGWDLLHKNSTSQGTTKSATPPSSH